MQIKYIKYISNSVTMKAPFIKTVKVHYKQTYTHRVHKDKSFTSSYSLLIQTFIFQKPFLHPFLLRPRQKLFC